MKASEKQGSSIGRCTDVGRIRAANEDSMGDLPVKNGHVLIVADGMGGYRGGALASHLVIEAIEEYFRDASIEHPQKTLRQAIYLANERIYLRGQQDEELSRMGSTCVLACVQNDQLYVGHVGDSRIYLSREDGSFRQLTKDHTVVQHFVDVGLLSQEEAENHPDGHILSRALGPRAYVEPEIAEKPLQLLSGDRVVLCSDGLTKMLSDKQIEEFVQESMNVQEIADRYIEVANEKGGEDNITVIVFEYMPENDIQEVVHHENKIETSTQKESITTSEPSELSEETQEAEQPTKEPLHDEDSEESLEQLQTKIEDSKVEESQVVHELDPETDSSKEK